MKTPYRNRGPHRWIPGLDNLKILLKWTIFGFWFGTSGTFQSGNVRKSGTSGTFDEFSSSFGHKTRILDVKAELHRKGHNMTVQAADHLQEEKEVMHSVDGVIEETFFERWEVGRVYTWVERVGLEVEVLLKWKVWVPLKWTILVFDSALFKAETFGNLALLALLMTSSFLKRK